MVSHDPDNLDQKVQIADTRSILAMAYHYAGDFDRARAIEQNIETISEYQAVVEANLSDHSTQLLIVGQRFKLAELQMLSDRWAKARQTISSAASELACLNDNQQLEGIVANYRAVRNSQATRFRNSSISFSNSMDRKKRVTL